MKDIVIIANFCRNFSETDNGRFMYLCKELSKGNKVEIVTSDFEHSTKKHKEPLVHNWPFTITFLHETGYKKNISIQRFKSHYGWGKEVDKYLKKRRKPDVIYCAVPSLTAPLKAAKYCEKNNVRFIIDIQDLWPEAFKMAFNIPVVSDVLFAPFNLYVNGIYKRADSICAVSQAYVSRARSVNKKSKTSYVVFLGTSLETFDNNVKSASPVIIKENNNDIWIGYCGSLTASYDIPCVLEALRIIKEKGIVPPKFVIMGDGAKKKEFELLAEQYKLDVAFLGKLEYDQMCAQLVQCDIVVNPIVKGSAASIINKHGDYAASGIPVLNTQGCKEYRDLVNEYKMGFNCRNGNAKRLADKLKRLVQDENLRLKMGKNARRCAEEKFDRKETYQALIKAILE